MKRDDQIRLLSQEGKGQREIARQIGISQPAVRKRLIKLGLLQGDTPNNRKVITTDSQSYHSGSKLSNQVISTNNSSTKQNETPNETLAARGPEHCSQWQTCGVCRLEPDKRKMLEEQYLQGFPSPFLATYFEVTPGDLASHAWLKHWYSKRKKQEDPIRREAGREALNRELWKTILESEPAGDTGNRIQAMKLAASLEGIGQRGMVNVQQNQYMGKFQVRNIATDSSEGLIIDLGEEEKEDG